MMYFSVFQVEPEVDSLLFVLATVYVWKHGRFSPVPVKMLFLVSRCLYDNDLLAIDVDLFVHKQMY